MLAPLYLTRVHRVHDALFVQVSQDSKQSRLTDHVSFDFEKRKFQLVKEFEARYMNSNV